MKDNLQILHDIEELIGRDLTEEEGDRLIEHLESAESDENFNDEPVHLAHLFGFV